MPFRQRLSQIKFDELIYLRKKVSTRSVCMCLVGTVLETSSKPSDPGARQDPDVKPSDVHSPDRQLWSVSSPAPSRGHRHGRDESAHSASFPREWTFQRR